MLTSFAISRYLRVCLPIFVGGAVYTLFGSPTLLVFDWYDALGLTPVVNDMRSMFVDLKPVIASWFLNSFPDGLWAYAYTSLMVNIWRHSGPSLIGYAWLLSGLILSVGSEFGQFDGLLPGTFDVRDIYFYVAGFLFALLPLMRVQRREVELCAN